MNAKITTQIEHVPTEFGQQGYARLVFLADGRQFMHHNFGCDHPTGAEISEARQWTAYLLYYNPHFTQYRESIYWLAFPHGE